MKEKTNLRKITLRLGENEISPHSLENLFEMFNSLPQLDSLNLYLNSNSLGTKAT